MSRVTLTDVTKIYGDDVIGAEDISFRIQDGEFLILVGPSGCGKSTTLELIAGLLRPTSGEIQIGDSVVNDTPPQDRDLAMVFQDYALYPHKTVRGNLLFGMKYNTDLPASAQKDKVEEVASLLGIADLLEQKPGQLSGGQQQRVALGRAIVRDPDVFLLDEPLSNLDAKLRTQMRAELQQLQAELDVTMIYVTHDQTEAMTMGDRIAVLNNGQVQQVGTPSEVYAEPTNEFVAQFIGSPSMNIFTTTVRGKTIRAANAPVQLDTLNEYADGEELRVGIRPEDVIVSEDSTQGNAVASVSVVENLGSENILHLDFANQDFIAKVDERVYPSNGDEVGLRFPEPLIYVFDNEGRTIKTRNIDAVEQRQPRRQL
jgi:multiple sugar transport system ATP-binding protein